MRVVPAAVPSPPTGPLELRALGGAVAAVAWGVPEWDGGSPILRYTVAVRDMRKTMWMQVGEVDAATLRFQIRDLTEERAYAIRVYAVNEEGASEPLESHEPFEVLPGEGERSARAVTAGTVATVRCGVNIPQKCIR
ncbi:jg27841, partial [Pararge aegeria aegeria]